MSFNISHSLSIFSVYINNLGISTDTMHIFDIHYIVHSRSKKEQAGALLAIH